MKESADQRFRQSHLPLRDICTLGRTSAANHCLPANWIVNQTRYSKPPPGTSATSTRDRLLNTSSFNNRQHLNWGWCDFARRALWVAVERHRSRCFPSAEVPLRKTGSAFIHLLIAGLPTFLPVPISAEPVSLHHSSILQGRNADLVPYPLPEGWHPSLNRKLLDATAKVARGSPGFLINVQDDRIAGGQRDLGINRGWRWHGWTAPADQE